MKSSFKDIFKDKKKDIEMADISKVRIQQQLRAVKTEQILLDEMKEREKKFEELHKDMVLLNNTYLTLAKLVDSQQENVDLITSNIENTLQHTEEACEDLKVVDRITRKGWLH